MENNIRIIEKPDWVSWDDIHNVLWAAHAKNRDNGIVMRFPSLSGEEIRQRIEGKGKMLCAIVDGKLAGTAAIKTKNVHFWFHKKNTPVAYECFASVLPEFSGRGLYKQLNMAREKVGKAMGFECVMFDTHEGNTHKIKIDQKNGYKLVDYKFYRDHYNVVMVKWLDGCPYSEARIKCEFVKRKIIAKVRRIIGD